MNARAFLGGVVMLCAVHASAATRPVIGDAWVYKTTFRALDEAAGKVTSDIFFVKAAYLNTLGKLVFTGSKSFGMYSETCLFDLAAGEELAGELPCGAPLPIGTTWRAAPKDPTKGSEQSLAVIGVEEVEIDSRSYTATVIRSERALSTWDYLGRSLHIVRRRASYWYVPELKGMAKIEHELIDDRGMTTSLESFTLLKFYRASELSDN